MIAEVKVVAEGLVTGSMQAKLHILQAPMRYAPEPSKPVCLPAKYASKCITRKGALIKKLWAISDDLPQLGLESAQPGHARHIRFM